MNRVGKKYTSKNTSITVYEVTYDDGDGVLVAWGTGSKVYLRNKELSDWYQEVIPEKWLYLYLLRNDNTVHGSIEFDSEEKAKQNVKDTGRENQFIKLVKIDQTELK